MTRPKALRCRLATESSAQLTGSEYLSPMIPEKMDEFLAIMKPEEIRDALWFVDVCARLGSMDQQEASEWRRRILARQAFLAVNPESTTN